MNVRKLIREPFRERDFKHYPLKAFNGMKLWQELLIIAALLLVLLRLLIMLVNIESYRPLVQSISHGLYRLFNFE